MKRILTTLSQKWPEYLLEILVLIIGIYGAFAVDNWRENQKEEREERFILSNLKADFEFNLKGLNDKHDLIAKSINSGFAILSHFSKNSYPSQDKADSLMYDVIGISTYNPAQGALHDALSTGKIELINDIELRKLLLSFSGKVEEINQIETRAADMLNKGLYPYLFDHFSFARMDAKLNNYNKIWPTRNFDSDIDFIFNDRKFESMVDDHVWRCHEISNGQKNLQGDIEKIIELINSEIQ